MDNSVKRRRATGMIVSAMLIWGSIGVFRRQIPVASAFLAFSRGMLGGLFLLGFQLLFKKGGFRALRPRVLLALCASGAAMGFNWILLFEAYSYTSVSAATLCYYMQPTIVTLLSPLLFQERLTRKKLLCAAVSLAGMALVSGVFGGAAPPEGHIKGVLLALGAALLYSTVVIMNKKLSGVDAYSKTTVQLLSAGAVMLPYLLLSGSFPEASVSVSTLALLLAVGLIHTGLAYLLYFGSIGDLKAQSVAILSYIDPVAALLFSAVFLGEALSIPALIGAALIIGSAVVSERPAKNPDLR